jgi:hypothetical protein
MKRKIDKIFMMSSVILLLNFFCMQSVKCQILQNDVLVSVGGFSSAGNLQMEFSLGEPVTETFEGTNMTLTQGFLQPILTVTSVESTDMLLGIKVFPNPVKAELSIDIPSENASKLLFNLFDMNGKLLQKNYLSSGVNMIDMQDHATGAYLLLIYETISDKQFQAKIIKIR